MWIGPANAARRHGARAIELARRTRDPTVSFFSHWSLAVVEGFTGHIDRMVRHMAESERVAISLRSPLLRLWTDELSIEHAWSMGEWGRGITDGERAIALARTLNQRTLLPRLLVWTSLIHLARGELETALPYIDEAWTISGAEGCGDGAVDVHTVVPAHIGRAAYQLARGDYRGAIRTAEAGLAIADRSGYPFWAIHRLLPIICEACLVLRDLDRAERVERRLRRDSERLGHRLGIAWSDACRALVASLSGDVARGAQLLRSAAESLDEIPIVPEAARLRRQLAGRMMELGDRDGALYELGRAFNVFQRLGARPELEKARLMFAAMGAVPPSRNDEVPK
jgi:tetratricopeptide (TPR) repeat protein